MQMTDDTKAEPFGAKLHSTMDAKVWAQEFMRLRRDNPESLDEGLMLAWFANAIMCGYDEACRRKEKSIDKLKSLILLTDPAVSNEEMNSLSTKQWVEWLRFDDAL